MGAQACVAAHSSFHVTGGSAVAASPPPPVINERQDFAVSVVVDFAAMLDVYCRGLDDLYDMGGVCAEGSPEALELLRKLATGTAGTGKAVVVRELAGRSGLNSFTFRRPPAM